MKSVTSRSVYKIMEMMSSSSSIWFMSSKEDSCLRKYFYTNCNSQQVEAFKISWYVTRDSESEISMQEGTRWCFRYKLSSTHQVFLLNFVWIVDCREDSSFMKKTRHKIQTVHCWSSIFLCISFFIMLISMLYLSGSHHRRQMGLEGTASVCDRISMFNWRQLLIYKIKYYP